MPIYNERINPAPLARQFNKDGYTFESLPIEEAGIRPNSPEAYSKYAYLKPELYALTSVIATHVFQQAYNQRNVLDMVRSLDRNYPFISLGANIRNEVYVAISIADQRFKTRSEEPRLMSVYDRLSDVVRLEHQLVPEIRLQPDIESFLRGGVNTASDVISNVLYMAALKVNDVSDSARMIRVAENSYPLVVKLASAHAESTIPVIEAFCGTWLPMMPFDGKYFTLKRSNGRERIDISNEGKDLVESVIGKRDFEDFRSNTSPIAGCPAMINLGDGSLVKTMWDWQMEAARLIYPRLKQGRA